MVHQKFSNRIVEKDRKVAKEERNSRVPPENPRNYIEELGNMTMGNGYVQQNEQSIMLSEAFRNEVSKRMGELLLKGQTMLDSYCNVCSGIIMEDRSGTQRCVTCELFEEKTKEAGESFKNYPLEKEDFEEAEQLRVVKDTECLKYSNMEEVKPQGSKSVIIQSIPLSKSCPENEKICGVGRTRIARNVVEKKLEWITEKLEIETSIPKIIELMEAMKVAAETLEAFSKLVDF